MSELKARHIVDVYDSYYAENPFGERSQVYLKSEADKVIAQLKADYKEACDRLQTANLIKDEQLAEARHEKYKRCMAKAEACMHKRWRTDEGFDYARSTRHMNKWLELAEKFKEAQ